LNSWMAPYDTGWLLNELGGAGVADWTDVLLGDDPTDKTDYITHNLNAPLYKLFVKVLISTDGTDNNSFEPNGISYNSPDTHYGYMVNQIDTNNIGIQTGLLGIGYLDSSGDFIAINAENWYYRVRVYYLG